MLKARFLHLTILVAAGIEPQTFALPGQRVTTRPRLSITPWCPGLDLSCRHVPLILVTWRYDVNTGVYYPRYRCVILYDVWHLSDDGWTGQVSVMCHAPYRYTGIYRGTSVQVYRCTGIQVYRCISVQVYSYKECPRTPLPTLCILNQRCHPL